MRPGTVVKMMVMMLVMVVMMRVVIVMMVVMVVVARMEMIMIKMIATRLLKPAAARADTKHFTRILSSALHNSPGSVCMHSPT